MSKTYLSKITNSFSLIFFILFSVVLLFFFDEKLFEASGSYQNVVAPYINANITISMAFISFIIVFLIMLFKRFTIDKIAMILFFRIPLYFIPVFYISGEFKIGTSFAVVQCLLAYFIGSQYNNSFKSVLKILFLINIIASIQVFYTVFYYKVSIFDSSLKWYMVTPVGRSNYITCITLSSFYFIDNYLKDKGKNILRLLFIGFNIATIICTGSKFAIILIIGYFIINFILVLLHGKFNKPLLNLGLILFISFIFALNIENIIPFISKLTSKFSLTIFNNRLLVYKDALNLFAINPIFGRSAYAYVVFDAVISHNFILESLVQTGIIGTLIYLTSIFLVLYKLLKNKNCDFKKYFCVFIVGYLIQGLEEPNLFEILSDCYFWLICGITMSFLRKKSFKEV